jgi:hypothetical protein
LIQFAEHPGIPGVAAVQDSIAACWMLTRRLALLLPLLVPRTYELRCNWKVRWLQIPQAVLTTVLLFPTAMLYRC